MLWFNKCKNYSLVRYWVDVALRKRRDFGNRLFLCKQVYTISGFVYFLGLCQRSIAMASTSSPNVNPTGSTPAPFPPPSTVVRLFLSGDVMLGRGVDQILQHHVSPVLYEGYVTNASDYVKLAVARNGPLPENRSTDYVWGDAIDIFKQMRPDVRIINLETSVTAGGEPWPNKGIHYRMHPRNVNVISAAGIHCCVLSNNHILDWSYAGLKDTLQTLKDANIKTVGAGANLEQALQPAVITLPHKTTRVLIFGAGSESAGVYETWQATDKKPGVNFFDESAPSAMIDDQIKKIKDTIHKYRRPRYDLVVYSLHWGKNWGFELEEGQREFAHKLIDVAGVDLVYGHSSHHIKGVEIYKGKLIAYGCGDLLTDYEGIQNEAYQGYRDDLSFMYFADLNATSGNLTALYLTPMRLRRMQIKRAQGEDEQYLYDTMKRECRYVGGETLDLERCQDLSSFKLMFF